MRRDPAVSRYAAGRLSPARRATDLARLRTERFDVLVVGGGVTGVGAALDAASRGLSVALVEAADLAAGTSSRSSKLIHGGLRYLEQLEFGLVHEALRERGLLATRLAPHLVRPLPILVPLEAGPPGMQAWNRLYYGAGVALYDTFAGIVGGERGMPGHRHLSRAGTRRLFPSLREELVAGAIRYYDGQVDDALAGIVRVVGLRLRPGDDLELRVGGARADVHLELVAQSAPVRVFRGDGGEVCPRRE